MNSCLILIYLIRLSSVRGAFLNRCLHGVCINNEKGRRRVSSLTVGKSELLSSEERSNSKLNIEGLKEMSDSLEKTGDICLAYRIEETVRSDDSNRASVLLYNTLLSSWNKMVLHLAGGTNTGSFTEKIRRSDMIYFAKDAALRAESILLEEMESPDVTSYNIVLDAWAKSQCSEYGVIQAENILKKLINSPSLEPDINSYNSVLEAYSHCSSQGSDVSFMTQGAEEIFSRVSSDPKINPNLYTYTYLINVWTKSVCNVMEELGLMVGQIRKDDYDLQEIRDRASKRVLQLLEEVKNSTDLKPTSLIYSACIDCLSRCNLPYNCESLLEEMEEGCSNSQSSLCPNIRTYTSIIRAWSWSSFKDISPHRCEAIVNRLESSDLKPNEKIYTALISSWAHSYSSDKATKAFQLFQKLQQLYKSSNNDQTFKPTINLYFAVIDACKLRYNKNHHRRSNETRSIYEIQSEALQIAFDVFQVMGKDKSVKANSKIYESLMKVTRNSLPNGKQRNDILSALFKKCSKGGYVSLNVLRQLRQGIDLEDYSKLLGEKMFDMNGKEIFENVPQTWSRNVKNE